MVAQLWHDVRYRLRAFFQRTTFDHDLQVEIDAHVARQAGEYMRQGVAAHEAWRQARIAFGAVEAIKAQTREARGTALLESCLQDLRDAVRALGVRPVHTVGAVVTLAIGIGALAMAFTATKAIRIDPLPYPDPDRLVIIRPVVPDTPDQRLLPTLPEYVAWRDQSNLFEAVGTLGLVSGDLGPDVSGASAETVVVQQSSTSLLRALQVAPLLGRIFTEEEGEARETPRVAMIGYDLWQRRFAAAPDVIGRTLDLDGVPTTIVGVMPDGASPQHNRIDVWAPIRLTPARLQGSGRGWPVIARLRPNVRLVEAQIETDVISARLARSLNLREAFATRVDPLRTAVFGQYLYLVTVVEVVAVAVFLAACASVAGLFFMRATSRHQALAVRAAVGAGRSRLAWQVVIEGALVAAAAGIAAVGVAWLGLEFVSASPLPLPPLVTPALDRNLLLFVGTTTISAGALLACLPALYVWRVHPADAMRAHGRHTDSPGPRRVRHTLVVGQIAVATVMLVGAGLLATTMHRIRTNPIGGDPHGVVTFTVRYPPAQYRTDRGSHDGLPLFEVSPVPAREAAGIRQRIEHLPGVSSAAVTSQVPFAGAGSTVAFDVIDDAPGSPRRSGSVQIVSARFFDTLRIPVIHGRDFMARDDETAPWTAIVNEAMAAELGGSRAVGRSIRLGLAPDERARTIVGVVGNTKPSPLASGVPPAIYLPITQLPTMGLAPRLAERLLLTFVARTSGDTEALIPQLRQVVHEVAPDRLPGTFQPLESAVTWQVAARQQLLIVFGFLAVTTTLLAAVGVYGAIAHHITEQTRNIGLRIAFGARTSDLWRLTLGRMIRLLVPGVAIGVVAAMTLSPAMDAALWGVSSGYAPVYVTAALVIGIVAVGTTAVLVRRVLAAPPAVVLNAT